MRRTVLLLAAAFLGASTAAAQQPTESSPPPSAGPALPPAPSAPHAPAGPPQPENLITFDYRQADVQWVNRHWVLMGGDTILKDFGSHESEAREALRVVQALRLTQLGRVGGPNPVIEYWLADGRAPQAPNVGRRVVSLDAPSLRVEDHEGQWYLRNDQRSLFAFLHPEDARQALDVIRRYGFTHVGYLGQSAPSMLVFLAGPSESGFGSHLAAPSPLVSRTVYPGHQTPPDAGHGPGAAPSPSSATPPGVPEGVNIVAPPGTPPAQPQPTAEAGTPTLPAHDPVGPTLGLNTEPERVPFDWRQVQVRQEKGVWKLTAGSTTLATFGPNQHDAQEALRVLQHYRFTEQLQVGRPAVFSYYLASGEAPRGNVLGVAAVPFEPAALYAKQFPQGWCVCSGNAVLAEFGANGEDAFHALDQIRRQKFDMLCHIGQGQGTGMTFLVRSH